MTKVGSEGDQYLREYPHLLEMDQSMRGLPASWSQARDASRDLPRSRAQYLRRYFDELALTTIYRALGRSVRAPTWGSPDGRFRCGSMCRSRAWSSTGCSIAS